MQKSKYYTPEIEEFHVGFNYQIEVPNGAKSNPNYLTTWISRNYRLDAHASMSLKSIRRLIEKKEIRVKYLDKEDIEECGFKAIGKTQDIWFAKEGYFDMGTWTSYKIIMQYGLHDKRLRMYADDPQGDDYVIFVGFIKNKSEFKKLLKQLKVT